MRFTLRLAARSAARWSVTLVVCLVLLLSLARTAGANEPCTVTKVSFDTRLRVTCGGIDTVGFAAGDTCVPHADDTLRLFWAILETALASGNLVAIFYDPNCQNAIQVVQAVH